MTAPLQPSLLFIEGEMNIYRAAELKNSLLAALTPNQPLELDLAGVTELDTSGVQLLMLAKRSAQTMQCELRLVSHSPAVLEVFELLDLAAWFGDPLLIAAA